MVGEPVDHLVNESITGYDDKSVVVEAEILGDFICMSFARSIYILMRGNTRHDGALFERVTSIEHLAERSIGSTSLMNMGTAFP